jgi:hypothetical protein
MRESFLAKAHDVIRKNLLRLELLVPEGVVSTDSVCCTTNEGHLPLLQK